MDIHPLPCAQVQAQAHAAQPRSLGLRREVPLPLMATGENLLPKLQPQDVQDTSLQMCDSASGQPQAISFNKSN